MIRSTTERPDWAARFAFWLMAGLLLILWFAGGSSRADVVGQPVTRFFAWTAIVSFALFSPRFDWRRAMPVALLVALTILIVALQLLPLPPVIWTALPGRELFLGASEVSGQAQPWRPISISPGATQNALGSLVVPATFLVLAANLTYAQLWRISELILAAIFAGCLVAIFQFSGAEFDNPLINYSRGTISGNFANRNHFALFIALGCLIAPVCGFRCAERSSWKPIAGVSLLPFFLVVLLSTGSRSGLVLGVIGLLLGLAIVWTRLTQAMRHWSRSKVYGIVGGALLVMAGSIALSLKLDRAVALDRAFDLQVTDDLRSQLFPFVMNAIGRYFPVGAGFGTFDEVFRMEEPDALLQPLYFNHAHNDWLEVILDGGLAAGALVAGSLAWCMRAIYRVGWKKREEHTLSLVGAGGLLLVMLASISDYPARTPLWMAILVIAAMWLHSSSHSSASRATDAS